MQYKDSEKQKPFVPIMGEVRADITKCIALNGSGYVLTFEKRTKGKEKEDLDSFIIDCEACVSYLKENYDIYDIVKTINLFSKAGEEGYLFRGRVLVLFKKTYSIEEIDRLCDSLRTLAEVHKLIFDMTIPEQDKSVTFLCDLLYDLAKEDWDNVEILSQGKIMYSDYKNILQNAFESSTKQQDEEQNATGKYKYFWSDYSNTFTDEYNAILRNSFSNVIANGGSIVPIKERAIFSIRNEEELSNLEMRINSATKVITEALNCLQEVVPYNFDGLECTWVGSINLYTSNCENKTVVYNFDAVLVFNKNIKDVPLDKIYPILSSNFERISHEQKTFLAKPYFNKGNVNNPAYYYARVLSCPSKLLVQKYISEDPALFNSIKDFLYSIPRQYSSSKGITSAIEYILNNNSVAQKQKIIDLINDNKNEAIGKKSSEVEVAPEIACVDSDFNTNIKRIHLSKNKDFYDMDIVFNEDGVSSKELYQLLTGIKDLLS